LLVQLRAVTSRLMDSERLSIYLSTVSSSRLDWP